MTNAREVTLKSGESVTVEEVFEAISLMAISDAPPLLTKGDVARAYANVIFDALDWAQERGIVQ